MPTISADDTNATVVEQRKEIEALRARLADQKLVFDYLLEATMAGWFDWHPQNDEEYLSPSFKKLFGYEDHELENSPAAWQRIIHQDDLPEVFEVYRKCAESHGKVPYDNKVRYWHKDGHIVWVYCRGKIVEWDAAGQPVRMLGTHVDITPLVTAEEELKRKVDELERLNTVMVDRELKMIELKKRVHQLELQGSRDIGP